MHAKQNTEYAYDDACKKVKYKCSYRSRLWIHRASSSRVEKDYRVIQESKLLCSPSHIDQRFSVFLKAKLGRLKSGFAFLDRTSISGTSKYKAWRATCVCRVFSDKSR